MSRYICLGVDSKPDKFRGRKRGEREKRSRRESSWKGVLSRAKIEIELNLRGEVGKKKKKEKGGPIFHAHSPLSGFLVSTPPHRRPLLLHTVRPQYLTNKPRIVHAFIPFPGLSVNHSLHVSFSVLTPSRSGNTRESATHASNKSRAKLCDDSTPR